MPSSSPTYGVEPRPPAMLRPSPPAARAMRTSLHRWPFTRWMYITSCQVVGGRQYKQVEITELKYVLPRAYAQPEAQAVTECARNNHLWMRRLWRRRPRSPLLSFTFEIGARSADVKPQNTAPNAPELIVCIVPRPNH
ncbi:hypothetical protein MSG28_008052 [Choristoneura fumiferana]|uniref:Uncharacterized protein n=1 Tax=Choristoneura fumiferana TaxID=7141 RepID=A0ACC0J9W7_CHOFU|nr:hypothetical protein MSG28_008052 [Choristoneura fumiferana]